MKDHNDRPRSTEYELDKTMDAGGDIFREDEQGGDVVEATAERGKAGVIEKEERKIVTVRKGCLTILN